MPSTAVGSEVTLRSRGFFFWFAMVADGKGLMVARTFASARPALEHPN